MFNIKQLTPLEAIDRQLIRLHNELDQISFNDDKGELGNKEYIELLRQIDQLSKELIRLSQS
jgi:hypothetical protein